MTKYYYVLGFVFTSFVLSGQADRWQQRVEYKMEIDFDVNKHQFEGKQKLKYWNNSPDTLTRIFYHLYFNAFQPESMMDVRSRTISDPDPRIGDRLLNLDKNEIGYHQIKSLKQNGKNLDYQIEGTILEVKLRRPILPGKTDVFVMEFKSQVPVQIRRSGRDNKEGIDYSMAQWYPKLCEYDYQGWHANPYIGREFYGVWGDFEVEIMIDDEYVLGGTGVLQNADKVGAGYSDKVIEVKGKKKCWKFKAENVHDFMWAADRDYQIDSYQCSDGPLFYFIYQPGERTTENWKNLPMVMDAALTYINKKFGKYPYPVYSFIQGGDGGMEYPMATLITGERSFGSLVGVSVHELMHSWYQMILGTNESLYAWMDEGFTTYASNIVKNHLRELSLLSGSTAKKHPNETSINGYVNLTKSGYEESLSTHSDHFTKNRAYGQSSYTKGAALITQLGYIIGEESLKRGLLKYYNTWKFKHPNVNDFIRIMEKESNIELDWYKEYFVNSIHTIDYSIEDVSNDRNETIVILRKNEIMPMPLDVVVTLKNGESTNYYIPLTIMREDKQDEHLYDSHIKKPDWPWTNPYYVLTLDINKSEIVSIEIDPSVRMADKDRSNNIWVND